MPFHKGQSGNPAGKPKGTKNGATLLREERRAQFDAWASANWQALMPKLPPTYVADQFLGKAPDITKMEVTDTTRELSQEELAVLADIVKRKKLSE